MATVLVATDGSDLALHAARSGLSLLKNADTVLIVSVVDVVVPGEDATGHAGPTTTPEVAEAANRDAREQGQAAVRAVVEALRASGHASGGVEARVIEGDPGPSVCRLAEEVQASAVVIGSRGRGGLKRALLGSVSDYVVRNAPCTVIVSRDVGE
jgi:nucleotide-binding universal stress UspA family protein